MTTPDPEVLRPHLVVVNDEEQYSVWPADRELPLGWQAVGVAAARQECLDYIERVWVDMRPRSVRLGSPPESTVT